MSGSGALHRFDQQPDHGEDALVGTFRFWFVGERWEWSDEVAAMHGYAPGSVVPTSALVLSHKHPDDRLHVQELLDRALHNGEPFSNTHRVIDTAGAVHQVVVVADRMVDESGAVVGTAGHYIDLTDTFDETRKSVLSDELPGVVAARAVIEQAKGALMMVYKINADQAFRILQWRSQQTNTKLRDLAAELVEGFTEMSAPPASLRNAFDHLLLTVHERAGKRG